MTNDYESALAGAQCVTVPDLIDDFDDFVDNGTIPPERRKMLLYVSYTLGRLATELKKREDFCQEFIWGEDHPREYQTLQAKVVALESQIKWLQRMAVIGAVTEHVNETLKEKP